MLFIKEKRLMKLHNIHAWILLATLSNRSLWKPKLESCLGKESCGKGWLWIVVAVNSYQQNSFMKTIALILACSSMSFKALLFIVENGTFKLTFCFTIGEANACIEMGKLVGCFSLWYVPQIRTSGRSEISSHPNRLVLMFFSLWFHQD